MPAMYSFEAVVKYFGGEDDEVASQVRMAERLHVSPQAVWQWKQRRGFPKLRTYQIEVLSRGHFRHHRLPICADLASAKDSH